MIEKDARISGWITIGFLMFILYCLGYAAFNILF